MGAIAFDLPWPPSVNRYYRHVGPRVLISREGRRYRRIVVSRLGGLYEKSTGPLALSVDLYPPDRRRRDIDNVGGKALLDALQAAGLFEDDSQVKDLHLRMLEPIPEGLVHATLRELEDERRSAPQ